MESVVHLFEIGKNMWGVTREWFGYINFLDKNMQNLKRKIEYLSSQESDINAELSSAEYREGKRRKKEVDVWLRDAQQMKDDMERLEQEVGQRTNIFSRSRLGKHIIEKIQEVEELQEKGRFVNGLVIDTLPKIGRFIPTVTYSGSSTSERNKNKVWECLMNDEVRRIGVFGMGGVGKTTIMQHINNQLLEEASNFDDVIWVTVPKPFNIGKLQSEVARALDFSLPDDEDEMRRASELHAKLSRKMKYVLILDDLWEDFPLEKLGVPVPTRTNGCKLVVTTRSLQVCKKMECRAVKVQLLTEPEALNLFMSKAIENETVLSPRVKEIAIKIAKECACLPLAIVAVAGSLRGFNKTSEWRNALNELISSRKEVRNDETAEIFEVLKFSYTRLKDKKLQHCFLYCALYPEDHDILIEELIDYWIAEGLIDEMDSIEAKLDKGHAILTKLTSTCLLESSSSIDGENCVRMHDLIRDMALRIVAHSPRFMVKAGEGLKRVPYEYWSTDLKRVSFMYNMIEEFPTTPPNCPRLTTLLLGRNYPALPVIPESFFRHMPRLEVLDLSFSFIQSLPESIANLENLHALILRDCTRLSCVLSLEKLKALKELILTSSLIRELPEGIEELVNLRKLDLSFNRRLVAFPSWKLCRLRQLQFLRLDATRVKVLAEDLLFLRQLKVLGVQFNNVQELTRYVRSQQCQGLEKYRLRVGSFRSAEKGIGKEVVVKTESERLGNGVDQLVLPSNAENFQIEECHALISLSDIESLRYARDLRECSVFTCDGMESIFSSPFFSEEDQIPLRTVELLTFQDLPSCRVLFDGIVPPSNISFSLTRLVFNNCPSMNSIFPAQLLLNFPNLMELEVVECEHVEHIIVEVGITDSGNHQDRSTITLSKFRKLNLEKLPRLKSIYNGKMVCKSLHDIYVHKCPLVSRLPLSLDMNNEQPSALNHIHGEEVWWESLVWDDPYTKALLRPFFSC